MFVLVYIVAWFLSSRVSDGRIGRRTWLPEPDDSGAGGFQLVFSAKDFGSSMRGFAGKALAKALLVLALLALSCGSCFLLQLSRQELSVLTSPDAARATWRALRSGDSFETLKRFDESFAELLLSNAVTSMQQDDGCVKFLLTLSDGLSVESVLITPRASAKSATTICISSQVGCAQGCRFCRTGTMGLQRNLTAEEMIAQVVQGRRIAKELALPKVLKVPQTAHTYIIRYIIMIYIY